MQMTVSAAIVLALVCASHLATSQDVGNDEHRMQSFEHLSPTIHKVDTLEDGFIRTQHLTHHTFDFNGHHANPRREFRLQYETHHHPDRRFFYLPDHVASIDHVSCGPNYTVIEQVKNITWATEILSNTTMLLLHAPPSYRCGGLSFFNHVESVTFHANGTIHIVDRLAHAHHIFRNATMRMHTNYLHVVNHTATTSSTEVVPSSRRWFGSHLWHKVKHAAKHVVHVVKKVAKAIVTGTFDLKKSLPLHHTLEVKVKEERGEADQGNGHVSCELDGTLSLGLGLHFELDIHHFGVHSMKTYASGPIDRTVRVGCEYERTWSKEKTLGEVHLGHLAFMAGPVPVVITPGVILNAEVGVDVTAGWSVTSVKTVTVHSVGIQYSHGKLHPMWHYGHRHSLSYEVHGRISVYAKLIPTLNFAVEAVLNAEVPVALGVEAHADLQSDSEECVLNLGLDAKVEVSVGASLGFDGHNIAEYQHEVYSKDIPLLSKCLIKPPSVCSAERYRTGTTLTAHGSTSHTITSDSDGKNSRDYNNKEKCGWELRCRSGERAQLEITYDTEPKFDFVSVIGDSCSGNRVLWKESGSGTKTVTSGHQNVCLKFDTDASGTRNGFTATFTCVRSSSRNRHFLPQQAKAALQVAPFTHAHAFSVFESFDVRKHPSCDNSFVDEEHKSFRVASVNTTTNMIQYAYRISRLYSNGSRFVNILPYQSPQQVANVSNFTISYVPSADATINFPFSETIFGTLSPDRKTLILEDDGCFSDLVVPVGIEKNETVAARKEDEGITKKFYAGLGIGIAGGVVVTAVAAIVLKLVVFSAATPKVSAAEPTA